MTNTISNVQSITNTVGSAVNTVTRAAANLGMGGVSSFTELWSDRLFPASWRGISFGVFGGDIHVGRRNAVHEYPYRNTVWVEDLGRSARRINMSGFLVGDDVIAQREKLIAICEQDGEGILVHPTLGLLTVSLLGSVSIAERWDKGRVFELSFTFIESGQREFPNVETNTIDAVNAAANAADAAIAGDFNKQVAAALQKGAAVVKMAVNTTQAWTTQAQKLSNDATNIYNMAGTLQGSFGRFFGGRVRGGLSGQKSAVSAANLAQLIAQGSAARVTINNAINTLSVAASRLGS